MANNDHLKTIHKGVTAWNKWRDSEPRTRPDLEGADLRNAMLARANLSRANLNGAQLGGANLRKALLTEATLWSANLYVTDLREADLSKAELVDAGFDSADLRGSNLSQAVLVAMRFVDADLSGADLTGAVFGSTTLGNTNLTNAKGLNTCVHRSASVVDHQTMKRSGILPVEFLRGCGLPDELIDFLPTLLARPGQFPTLFISYSSRDEEFAQRLHTDLQDKGVRCWYAPHDLHAGKKLHEQIREAIDRHDRLLLVLSENSMKSEWVKTEIANARAREAKEGKRILFPIRLVNMESIMTWQCLDADTGKDSAREVREYYIPDFQHWREPKAYKKGLDGLLEDLRMEAKREEA